MFALLWGYGICILCTIKWCKEVVIPCAIHLHSPLKLCSGLHNFISLHVFSLLQDAAKSNDLEFFKSQLQLFSKICKVYTYILLCTVSFEDNISCAFFDKFIVVAWRICFQGNNAQAITALDRGHLDYITFQKALQCAKDKGLQPSLRSKYVELIKGQYGHAIAPLVNCILCWYSVRFWDTDIILLLCTT